MKTLKNILHVDDDADIREITRIALSLFDGFETVHCMSGREAIAQAPGFMPDLFLLDSRMPVMDGEETWSELRKLPGMRDVPVIFMTARAQAREVDHLMEIGAIGVITKPFDPVKLVSSVQEMWARHQSSAKGHGPGDVTRAAATL